MEPLHIVPVPAFDSNYLWIIHNDHSAFVVDPGEAKPVLQYLKKNQLSLSAILITHKHADHIGGTQGLLGYYPHIPVYANPTEKIALASHPVQDGDHITIPTVSADLSFQVMEIPGHTLGHIAYYAPGILFPGDTLFSGGCGRVFEGTYSQMYYSLQKLAALPDETKIYCAHEYTLSNLAFALTVNPHNHELQQYFKRAKELRYEGLPTLPSTLLLEKKINPFLRCRDPEILNVLGLPQEAGGEEVFELLRRRKDHFKA